MITIYAQRRTDSLLSFDVCEQRVRALRWGPWPALSALVGLDVFGKVVAPHEPLPTLLASKALLTSVRAKVPLQLVWAGEALTTEEPITDEGPLPGVPPQMCLQVRSLLVHFAALWDVADVQSLLSEFQPPAVGLAVGALAAATAASGAKQTLGRALKKSGYLRLVPQN